MFGIYTHNPHTEFKGVEHCVSKRINQDLYKNTRVAYTRELATGNGLGRVKRVLSPC